MKNSMEPERTTVEFEPDDTLKKAVEEKIDFEPSPVLEKVVDPNMQ